MIIMGEKVKLRAIELSDCDLLLGLINDPETEYLLGGWSFPVSKAEQQQWIENITASTNTLRVMVDVESQTIGTAILSDVDYKNGTAQIHIKLCDSNCRHKGFGTDVIHTLVAYAFDELRLHCIYAQVNQHNIPSQKLFLKCGFQQEGILRERLFKKGEFIDVLMFSILNNRVKNDE